MSIDFPITYNRQGLFRNKEKTEMKILFVFSVPAGGMETLNFERNIALTKEGIECHFLYLRNPKSIESSERLHFIHDENGIKLLVQKHQFEAILICTDFHLLKTLRKIGYHGKIIYEIQGIGDLQLTESWINKSKIFVQQYADAILYPKTAFLDKIIKKHFSTKNLFSFHNCIDTNIFRYCEVAKLNAPVLGWVGRLDNNKNWKEFLLIGASLKKEIPHIQLWMFHDPELCPQYVLKHFTRLVKNLNLQKSVTLYEKIPRQKMPYYYSLISNSNGLLCSTSKQEGFGYAVIEAMSCYCPVLTTKSGGVETFVIHNMTGKLYDQGDIHQAVTEAKELIQNPNLRKKLIEQADYVIRKDFTPKQYCCHFMNILKDLSLPKN